MINPDVFNKVPIFTLLDADERAVLLEQVIVRHFKKGDVVFKTGGIDGCAYIVEKGSIKLTLNDLDNKEILMEVIDENGSCGISSLLGNTPHPTTAIAIEDTDTIEIDRNDISILLTQRPLAGLKMMSMFEKHLRTTHDLRNRISRNPNKVIKENETLGDRMADGVAHFGGSWTFVIAFGIVLIVYVSLNIFINKPWDPYPYILLNLFLSMLAAIQAPVIIMSQNRQDAKDRLRSELGYRVNFKAELEVNELLQRMASMEQKLEGQNKET